MESENHQKLLEEKLRYIDRLIAMQEENKRVTLKQIEEAKR